MSDDWLESMRTHGLTLVGGGASHPLQVMRVTRAEDRGTARTPRRVWVRAQFRDAEPDDELRLALQELWQLYDDGAFAVADALQEKLLHDLRVTTHDGRELSLAVVAMSPDMVLELSAEEPLP